MKKIVFVLLLAAFAMSCGTDKMSKTIEKNHLGDINKDTSLEELDLLFKGDSIEKFPEGEEIVREFRVFDAQGKPSLVILPFVENDTVKGIELIKIYDASYTTEKGISTASTFKEIADQYSISKIEPAFTAAVLFIDELNATISLNKKDLNLDEFDMRPIVQEQIPDLARVNYITLWLR